ncbi:hypothetical protein PIB30_010194 [Stylosanthes scabra]|uniref:Uncharacterized protein n=1 Tax=Stylosanthes scabra TaxID=79078 RepID=A0ABU6R6V9_9FABA|nr:hypothetical protein [Stylosanthes scabra]
MEEGVVGDPAQVHAKYPVQVEYETKPEEVDMANEGKQNFFGGGDPQLTGNKSASNRGKAESLWESSGSALQSIGVAANSSRYTQPELPDDSEGNGLQRVMEALEALEGRVSQLEMDKWELLM